MTEIEQLIADARDEAYEKAAVLLETCVANFEKLRGEQIDAHEEHACNVVMGLAQQIRALKEQS